MALSVDMVEMSKILAPDRADGLVTWIIMTELFLFLCLVLPYWNTAVLFSVKFTFSAVPHLSRITQCNSVADYSNSSDNWMLNNADEINLMLAHTLRNVRFLFWCVWNVICMVLKHCKCIYGYPVRYICNRSIRTNR